MSHIPHQVYSSYLLNDLHLQISDLWNAVDAMSCITLSLMMARCQVTRVNLLQVRALGMHDIKLDSGTLPVHRCSIIRFMSDFKVSKGNTLSST